MVYRCVVILLLCACTAGGRRGGSTSTAEDGTWIPAQCVSETPCATNDDCEGGERCNDTLSPPQCQTLYCAGPGAACSEAHGDLLCEEGLTCCEGRCVHACGEVEDPCDDAEGHLYCRPELTCCFGRCLPTRCPTSLSAVGVGNPFPESMCMVPGDFNAPGLALDALVLRSGETVKAHLANCSLRNQSCTNDNDQPAAAEGPPDASGVAPDGTSLSLGGANLDCTWTDDAVVEPGDTIDVLIAGGSPEPGFLILFLCDSETERCLFSVDAAIRETTSVDVNSFGISPD